ncbi:MAG: alpha/beta hydrolase family protein, partial [Fimbriimonas sp.]
IVHVNGHWAHKKSEDRLQLRAAFSALHGYIAIVIDTPGWSFEGNSLMERRPEGDHNDFKLVQGGSNTTGYYVWDCMRALDYMATRSDTDMDRVGITGASGGGLATLYTFAADDRYKAAVPVVYMSSMELAPDNGCLCNHVPGTMQIGDRSDVIAIQAPKPVLVMGAEVDGEFPPDAMRLTHKKMAETWKLFGKDGDVSVKIFSGGHDYSQPMREAMIGFFDRALKGVGDGSPVAQPLIQIIDPEDRQLLALDPLPTEERTMRDLSMQYLANAPKAVSVEEALRLNGGVPTKTDSKAKWSGGGNKRQLIYESEPGLVTPAVLIRRTNAPAKFRIIVSDQGKAAEIQAGDDADATLYLDTLGVGELKDFELRYPVYLGRSVAFTAGWQIVRAAELLGPLQNIELVGKGPLSSQAVMWAALISPGFAKVTGIDSLKTWTEIFNPQIPATSIQPRAHLLGTLESLRSHVKKGTWP